MCHALQQAVEVSYFDNYKTNLATVLTRNQVSLGP